MYYFFFGEIGVGKTTFINYLINNLQKSYKVKLTEIPSPTFNLLHEYKLKDLIIQHYDLFRIANKDEIKNIGLFENCSNILTLVEWPEMIKKKPRKRFELLFKYKSETDRRILKINEFK